MSDLDMMQSGKLCVGEELTKATIILELSKAMDFLKRCDSSKQSTTVCVDFIKLEKVDTLAVVFIVQIQRFVETKTQGLKITYQNLPNDLNSLLNLTSMAQAIFND